MAAKLMLTAKRVQSIKLPEKGQKDYFDAALPSFALRVSSKGGKSYVLLYRPKAKPNSSARMKEHGPGKDSRSSDRPVPRASSVCLVDHFNYNIRCVQIRP